VNTTGWRERVLIPLVLALMVGTSILLAFQTPTFDFDEALYRRLAEEMKVSHQYFGLTWDGRAFYEKPPTYVWTIVMASRVIDGPSPAVSIFACRAPSLLFSILTLTLLSLFWRRRSRFYAAEFGASPARRGFCSAVLPVVAFGAALFPMVQVTSVLLDPMLTLFLTVVLLIFTGAMLRRGETLKLSITQTVVAGVAMALAVAVKGLIGIVLPAIAIGAHEVLSALAERRWPRVVRGVLPAFALATALSCAVFAFFYRSMGLPFVREFLIRQHFVRGSTTFQGHGGPVFYYLILLFMAGPAVAFTCVALFAKSSSRLTFSRWGFPLSWSAALVLFISLLATKLPNYTWPLWPAVALSLCVLMVRADTMPPGERGIGRIGSIIATIGMAATGALAIAALAGSFGLDMLAETLMKSLRARTLLTVTEPWPLQVRLGLGIIAVAFALQIVQQRSFLRKIRTRAAGGWSVIATSAALNCTALMVASFAVVPHFDQALRGPLERVSRTAAKQQVTGGDLTTIALFSPTISSSYGGGAITQVGSRGPYPAPAAEQHLVLVPVWQSRACRRPGFDITDSDAYLLLCRSRKSTHGGT
jgi:4-amino-4-deoxy-L-arabinose transferase-like glycosyltransferase